MFIHFLKIQKKKTTTKTVYRKSLLQSKSILLITTLNQGQIEKRTPLSIESLKVLIKVANFFI